jgi:hypothetical protein
VGGSPTIVVEGGIPHVHNRVSRGEHASCGGSEAERRWRLLPETEQRDGFHVLSWCLMPNRDYLALRM